MATKTNSKPSQTPEMELFPQVVTGFETNSESCQTCKVELKIITIISAKTTILDV